MIYAKDRILNELDSISPNWRPWRRTWNPAVLCYRHG